MHFGQKLREMRESAGLTQMGLADASGVPVGTIRDYEQMKRSPLLPAVQKLAKALKASLAVFDKTTFDDVAADVPRPAGRPLKSVSAAKASKSKAGKGSKGKK